MRASETCRRAALAAPFLLIVSLPVVLLFFRAAQGLPALLTANQGQPLFNWGREAALLAKTVSYAAAVAVTVTLAGILGAIYISGPGRQTWPRWAWLLLVALPVPSIIHALAWLKWISLLNRIGLGPIAARGWMISWFVQSLAMLPVAVLIIAGGMLTLNLDQIQAARLLDRDSRFAFRLLPGLLQPQILTALAITFVLTINDYAIPSIFSVNTYAIEIFVEYSSSLSLTRTVLKSIPLILLQLPVMILGLNFVPKVFLSGRSGEFTQAGLKYPALLTGLVGLGPGLVLVQILAPLSIMLPDRMMWLELPTTAVRTSADWLTSLAIAFLAALLALPLSYWTARWLMQSHGPHLALLLILLPIVLPSTLVGTALINLFNHPLTNVIYNSILMPVLGVLGRFVPFAVIIVLAWLRRLDQSLLDAAALLEGSACRNSLRIRLPMISTGLFLGSALVFLFSLGELGATVIVVPPGLSTVTIRLYNYLHYGATEMVLGLAFMIMLTIAVPIGLVRLILRRWRS